MTISPAAPTAPVDQLFYNVVLGAERGEISRLDRLSDPNR
jgi:hypothetical protein